MQTPDPLVEAAGLVKRFDAFTAVAGIDVTVHRGEAFGFLGPNGAGKSSTMGMIGCVSPASEGHLRVLGLDPATHGPQIRARLGVVPQQDNLDTELWRWASSAFASPAGASAASSSPEAMLAGLLPNAYRRRP